MQCEQSVSRNQSPPGSTAGNTEREQEDIKFEEVEESEIDEIWSIFFPYTAGKSNRGDGDEMYGREKPRRHLRFLTM